MKAYGLTISIPVEGNRCDKNCPYCISEMTGLMTNNAGLVQRNLPKVFTYAQAASISNVLITSKREPMLNPAGVIEICRYFNQYPVEVQTNGIWLNKNQDILSELFDSGLNVIAFSIDSLKQINSYKGLFENVVHNNMLVRVCINLTDIIPVEMGFNEIFDAVESVGNVRQLLFRNVMCPSNVTGGKQYDWIKKHTSFDRYLSIAQQFDRIVMKESKKHLRKLPFGMTVWGHRGISVSFSDYCIQEGNEGEDVRSLIYLEDGHLYDGWVDLASVIF